MAGVPAIAKNFTDITVIFNDETKRTRLQNFLDEAVRCKQRILDEQESIKGIRESACDELQIKPKLFNVLVGSLFNNDFEERLEDLEQVEMALRGLLQIQN